MHIRSYATPRRHRHNWWEEGVVGLETVLVPFVIDEHLGTSIFVGLDTCRLLIGVPDQYSMMYGILVHNDNKYA